MKRKKDIRKIFAAFFAALFAALCLPLIAACSGEATFTLKEDEEGNKYYVASLVGFKLGLSGELEIPDYFGEGELRAPVKEIAENAFSGTGITKVTIPATVERIGSAAFANNFSLREVVFKEGSAIANIPWGCFAYCNIKTIDLPSTLTKIEGMAFFTCESLTEITLPSGLESVGFRAFENCSALKEVNFNDGLKRIEERGFCGCSSLERIILPDSLIDGEEQEDGETKIVPALGKEAFSSCSSLKLAVVREGITVIESGVFSYCSALEEVYLPLSLREICGVYAYETALTAHAFAFNEGLTNVYFGGSEEDWLEIKIENTPVTNNDVTSNNDAVIKANKIYNRTYNN